MAECEDPPASSNTIDHWMLDLSLEEATGIQEYCGLLNPGSTCYLNSVLQTLFMTEEFRQHVKRLHRDGVSSDGNLVKRLNKLFNKLKERKEPVVSAAGIRKSLNIINVDEQADAAQHLESIIRKTPGSSEFFKVTMTKRSCSTCRDKQEALENHLSLPVSFEDHQDVEDAVQAYVDQMCGEYPLYCSQCKVTTDWESEMINFPKILIVQLRRFEMDSSGFRKSNRRVKIRPDIEVSSVEYDLYAIINHSGTYQDGHYNVDIKCEDETWFHFDDKSVSESPINSIFVNESSALSSSDAYLLVYRHRDTQSQSMARAARERRKAGGTSGDERQLRTAPGSYPLRRTFGRIKGERRQ